MTGSPRIVFLSYAKEDRRRILNIYRRLREAGLNPWMDHPPKPWQHFGLRPGQDWDAEIRRKMDEAAVLLLFLSKRSVAKEGYIQREFRLALRRAAECPSGRITVVPILLECCDVPDLTIDAVSLRSIHWHPQYRSSLRELVQLVLDILTPASLAEGTAMPTSSPASELSEFKQFFRIVSSIEVAEEQGRRSGPPISQLMLDAFAAVQARDFPKMEDVIWGVPWYSRVTINLPQVTDALLSIHDPEVATAAALVLAGTLQGSMRDSMQLSRSERIQLKGWLDHNVPEVAAAGAVTLCLQVRKSRAAISYLREYCTNPGRLPHAHMLFRPLVRRSDVVGRLAALAPVFVWETFGHNRHLAGMELCHVAFESSEADLCRLLKSHDWRIREIAAAIWAGDRRVPTEQKLCLLSDREPRVRFRALEGLLHTADDVNVLIECLIKDPFAQNESRIFAVHRSGSRSGAFALLKDRSGPPPSSPTFSGGGLGSSFSEAVDLAHLSLHGLIRLGEGCSGKLPEWIPAWASRSVVS